MLPFHHGEETHVELGPEVPWSRTVREGQSTRARKTHPATTACPSVGKCLSHQPFLASVNVESDRCHGVFRLTPTEARGARFPPLRPRFSRRSQTRGFAQCTIPSSAISALDDDPRSNERIAIPAWSVLHRPNQIDTSRNVMASIVPAVPGGIARPGGKVDRPHPSAQHVVDLKRRSGGVRKLP